MNFDFSDEKYTHTNLLVFFFIGIVQYNCHFIFIPTMRNQSKFVFVFVFLLKAIFCITDCEIFEFPSTKSKTRYKSWEIRSGKYFFFLENIRWNCTRKVDFNFTFVMESINLIYIQTALKEIWRETNREW